MNAPRDVSITYRPHAIDCVLAVYPGVHVKNFRVPQSDDVLKSRAIHSATIRLHKLFQRAGQIGSR
jgi:hypothetical protein